MAEGTAITVRGLSKTYRDGTRALRDCSFEIPNGQLVAVIGRSGAGKSTLLRCINRLVEPTAGQVMVNGTDATAARGRELRSLRRQVGMVFQHFNLVERHTAVRNVLHGRLGYTGSLKGALGAFSAEDVERALEILEQLGLGDEAFKRCTDLSGGQKQRVGIGRAMMQGARIILADEPIASLDPWSSQMIMETLKDIAVSQRITAIVNLHQVEFARKFGDRIIGLRGGEIVYDSPTDSLDEKVVETLYDASPAGQAP